MAESRQRPVGKGGFRFPPFPTPNPLETTKHRGAAAPLLDVPPGPSIAASYNRGNTKQHRHAPMPTYAATERIPGSATTPRHPPTQAAKKCWIGPQLVPVPPTESPVDGAGPLRGVKTGRRIPIWNHLTRTGAPFSLDSKNRSFSSREAKRVLSSSQSPHRSKRPVGRFSLRSLARPLPTRPAALGSRGGPIVAVLPSSPWKGEGFIEVRGVRPGACLLTIPWPAGPGGRSSGAAGGRCGPSVPPFRRRPPG